MSEKGKFNKFSLESMMVHKLDCFICGKEAEVYLETAQEAVDDLFLEGWRHVLSEEYQSTGICCPTCVEKEDVEIENDRGCE